MKRIMFVCLGNICRSPMAEFIFKDMVKKAGLENEFIISSCATSTDEIIGGIGNDSVHGGGGDDIFCFGNNWGVDTVEQLAGGSVTLWFESGSASNWNASTLTYTDGTNTVKVSGVDTVTLKFGTDASLPDGCFADAASEKIFEDKDSGMLA